MSDYEKKLNNLLREFEIRLKAEVPTIAHGAWISECKLNVDKDILAPNFDQWELSLLVNIPKRYSTKEL
jgi:hypothetical protein